MINSASDLVVSKNKEEVKKKKQQKNDRFSSSYEGPTEEQQIQFKKEELEKKKERMQKMYQNQNQPQKNQWEILGIRPPKPKVQPTNVNQHEALGITVVETKEEKEVNEEYGIPEIDSMPVLPKRKKKQKAKEAEKPKPNKPIPRSTYADNSHTHTGKRSPYGGKKTTTGFSLTQQIGEHTG